MMDLQKSYAKKEVTSLQSSTESPLINYNSAPQVNPYENFGWGMNMNFMQGFPPYIPDPVASNIQPNNQHKSYTKLDSEICPEVPPELEESSTDTNIDMERTADLRDDANVNMTGLNCISPIKTLETIPTDYPNEINMFPISYETIISDEDYASNYLYQRQEQNSDAYDSNNMFQKKDQNKSENTVVAVSGTKNSSNVKSKKKEEVNFITHNKNLRLKNFSKKEKVSKELNLTATKVDKPNPQRHFSRGSVNELKPMCEYDSVDKNRDDSIKKDMQRETGVYRSKSMIKILSSTGNYKE